MGMRAQQFRDFLLTSELKLEEGKIDEGKVIEAEFFAVENIIGEGSKFKVIAYFPKDDCQVSIFSLNYIKFDLLENQSDQFNQSKTLIKILAKINELNIKYTYCKFTLNPDMTIQAVIFLDAEEEFRPKAVLDMMILVCQSLKDEYNGLMKLID